MSELSIKNIYIKNFKVFRDFNLPLKGNNLLLYGANGSGKSSLYWALHTFLQSANKSTGDIIKYFDPGDEQHLINLFAIKQGEPGEITISLQNSDTSNKVSYTISKDKHGTKHHVDIQKANLASDFITYRVLFRFYHFTNSQETDLWPVFEHEILPFCESSVLKNIATRWRWLETEDNNPLKTNQIIGRRGQYATRTYDEFYVKVNEFNTGLKEIINSIETNANEFYKKWFVNDTQPNLILKLNVIPASYYYQERKFNHPKIILDITFDSTQIFRPQSFLNEAKLTQVALSIRFAATKTFFHEAPLKLLVIDDLLISLDMDNRMEVIDIILNDEDFKDYQKVVMTHDYGFYQEIRRRIGDDHCDWVFKRINGKDHKEPIIEDDKDDLQKAEDYLNNHDLEACANQLRKYAEKILKNFAEHRLNALFKTGDFHSLADLLTRAKTALIKKHTNEFNKLISCADIADEQFDKLLLNTLDIDSDTSLSPEEKGKLKLIRNKISSLIKGAKKENIEAIEVLEQVDHIKDRILNPASHGGAPPLYKREVKDAVKILQRLQRVLDKSSP